MADVLVIDVCPKCQGIWFEKAEIDFLKERARKAEEHRNLALALMSLGTI